jgi:hypothetical protein
MRFHTEVPGQFLDTSPRLEARIAGLLYLLNIAAGAFIYGFVRTSMIAPGDASTTAVNILKHELVYRLGFVAGLIPVLCNVPLALIFYDLFKVVNKSISALVAFFTLVATAIEAVNLLNYFIPLILLNDSNYVSAFKAQQLQAFAYMSLVLHAIGFNLALVFFAFYDLLIGYLIFKSTFLPRIVGVLMVIGGLCYLANSFATFLSPGFAAHLVPYIQLPSGVAELSLCLWLLIAGVNVPSWKQAAGAAKERREKATV